MSANGLHLVMPMGGSGSRFLKEGITIPKPLILLKGFPFFYWSVRSLEQFNEITDITFVVLNDHVKFHGIDSVIKRFYPDASIIVIPEVLPGPVFTCIKGVENIVDDFPIIFNDCDHLFKSTSLNRALKKNIDFDGGLVTFEAYEPQFSYICFQDGRIVGTAEKQVVSNRAICGAYLFKNKNMFIESAQSYISSNTADERFMSGVYNSICQCGGVVKEFSVDYHINFGTPEEYTQAKMKNFFDLK